MTLPSVRCLPLLALLLAGAGCSELLHTPAEAGPTSLAIVLSSASTGRVGASPGAAFDKADSAHVRVRLGETTKSVTLPFTPGATETRLRVELEPAVANTSVHVTVELRRGAALLFRGSDAVTMQPSGATPVNVTLEPVVAQVRISQDLPTFAAIGASHRLTGAALFATGDTVTTDGLTWRSLDTGVLVVTPEGQATAQAEGEARVEAVHGSLADAVVVPVRVVVARVTVDPPMSALLLGATRQFTAAAADANGHPITGRAVSWTSSQPEIASVDPATGAVRGLAVGPAAITATVDGVPSGAATVSVEYPAPALGSLSPSEAVEGGAGFTLVVRGSDFVATSRVHWNGSERATQFVSAGELRAGIPQGDIAAAGTATVTVVTPLPGGGTSAGGTFTITSRPAIALSVTSRSFSAMAGGSNPGAQTVNVTNSGTGTLAGLGTSISYTAGQPSGWLTAALNRTTAPATLTLSAATGSLAAGTYTASARVSSTGASNTPQSVEVTFTVVNPAPSITALSQSSAVAGAQGFTLTVNGMGFVAGSAVRWKGTVRATQFVSATQLRATIPASDLANPDTADVTVFNPAPGGGTSGVQRFVVTPRLPAAPTNLRASVAGTTVTLVWTDNSNNEIGFHIYRKYQRGNYVDADWTRVHSTNLGNRGDWVCATGSSCEDRLLEPGATYHYYVTAFNAAGESPGSNQDTISVLVAPSHLSASEDGDIYIGWRDNSDEQGFHLERRTGTTGSWGRIATVGAGVTFYQDREDRLNPNTTYYYRVQAYHSRGTSSFSNIDSATTALVPPLVETRSATLVAGGARFNGHVDPRNSGPYENWYEWSTSASLDRPEANPRVRGTTSSTWWTERFLYGSRTYYFRLAAENQAGRSYGRIMSITTPAPQPPLVATDSVTAITSNSARFWTSTTNLNGADVQAWFEVGTDGRTAQWNSSGNAWNWSVGGSVPGSWWHSNGWVNFTPETTYWYRAVARNSAGTSFGPWRSFRTLPAGRTAAAGAAMAPASSSGAGGGNP